jgi:predicted ATPase/DNA-binding SARP family transcriptional activator
VRIGLLGPLRVWPTSATGANGPEQGGHVDIAGGRLRTLLVRLAIDAGRPVSTGALIDAIWSGEPPAGAAGALQALVSRLRRVLPEPAALTATPTGYRLDARVDAHEFVRLVTGSPTERRSALSLWRGPLCDELAGAQFGRSAGARLEELRLSVLEERIEADLDAGASAELVAELSALIADQPLREKPANLLIRTLAELGRPAEALRAYEHLRATLADQLGTDPSSETAELHLSILRGTKRPRSNLPAALTSFVGREEPLRELAGLLAGHRLVTLVGPGGSGKTRLAVEAARDQIPAVRGGCWLVELAPVRDPAGVPHAALTSLGTGPLRRDLSGTGLDPLTRLCHALAGQRLLIILDNCEHLIDPAAHLAAALLARCPEVRILATSREPLAITGEALYPVGPLAAPPRPPALPSWTLDRSTSTGPATAGAPAAGAAPTGLTPAQALAFPAVRLFADRAAAIRPGTPVTDRTVEPVVEVCRRLDGMPLAIELAAARLRTLPIEEVAARLGDRFRLLTGGSRTALPRHQTLRAVVEWSWDLLGAPEKRLARRFSVFPEGSTVDSAVRVCGSDLDTLTSLVDRSLIRLTGAGRYTMLETIRAYAAEQLEHAGEAYQTRVAHAEHYLALAEEAEPHLRRHDQIEWLERLVAERDNLTAALRWSVDIGDADRAVRMCAALGWFWSLRAAHTEALALIEPALALDGDQPAEARAVALVSYGMILMSTGELRAGLAVLDQAGDTTRFDHPLAAAIAPMAAAIREDLPTALAAIAPLLERTDPWLRAMALALRGRLGIESGNAIAAERDLTEALAMLTRIGDRWGRAVTMVSLAEPRGLRGDRAGQIEALLSAVTLTEELGVADDTAMVLCQLATALGRGGDLTGARTTLERAKLLLEGMPLGGREAMLMFCEGELTLREGDSATALRLFTRAMAGLEAAGALEPEKLPYALTGLAMASLAAGDTFHAVRYSDRLWALGRRHRHPPSQAIAAQLYAEIAVCLSRPAEAAALLGSAEAIRGVPDLGNPDVLRVAAASRKALGDHAYAAGYAEAASRSSEEAASTVRALRTRRRHVPGFRPGTDGVSARTAPH